MKKFKRVITLVLAMVLVLSLAACSNTSANTSTSTDETASTTSENISNDEKVKVVAIKGPTGMGMVDLTDSDKYEFTLTSDPTEVVSLISTGAVDIAACPLNLAANLYKKTGGKIKMLGINTLGVLYVMTNGVEVNSINDLKDKTIYATGQGSTPEYIIDYILDKNGLKDSVKVEYLSEHSELMTKLVAGEVSLAILPEPYVSVAVSKNSNVKSVLSLTDEWEKLDSDTKLAMGCVIARSDFIDENPDAVKQFIEDNKQSVENVNVNAYSEMNKMIEKGIVDEAILSVDESVSEKKIESAKETKAAEIVTRCNIVFINGEMMNSIANANFEVYYSADPTSVGGEIPSSDIYYAAE